MEKLPLFLKPCFWDVDFEKLDAEKQVYNIIGRILENGNQEAIQWLIQHYSKEQMAEVLFRFRFVSPKSANYWVLILNLPRENVLCLQKHYQKKQRRHWNY